MSNADLALLARVAVGFVLAYALGFERQLRGSPAGDRTFALVGASVTAITAVAARSSPQTVAGALTGIGFIGGGIVFHGEGGLILGVTSAATLFAAAAVGVVVGYGHIVLGIITSAGVLLTLEIQHVPMLRRLEARHFKGRFEKDSMFIQADEPPGRIGAGRGLTGVAGCGPRRDCHTRGDGPRRRGRRPGRPAPREGNGRCRCWRRLQSYTTDRESRLYHFRAARMDPEELRKASVDRASLRRIWQLRLALQGPARPLPPGHRRPAVVGTLPPLLGQAADRPLAIPEPRSAPASTSWPPGWSAWP